MELPPHPPYSQPPEGVSAIETDAVVIGAGPVGLFQAFQLGLQEIDAHLIDALPHPGGQCAELYADKPIYDIPGIPVCTGQELTERLLQQVAPFKTPMHLGQQVHRLAPQPDGRFLLQTSSGHSFLTRTVFIAAGVGAFVPRKPALEALHSFEGRQVLYHATGTETLQGRHVVVMGGEDPALDTVLQLAASGACASITLLHRADRLKAEAGQDAAVRQAIEQGTVRFVIGQPVGIDTEGERLTTLQVATPEGETLRLPLDLLLPRLGLSPRLGPVADWELAIERKQLVVDTERFSTSVPGIFAVGDINTYPGKKKLILCGFHEATLAAFAAVQIVHPQQRVLLQYTTTSPRLHQLLGVSRPSATGEAP